MNVNKVIDIKMLKDMLGNMIEMCQTSLKPRVELDYETAIIIYDVLEEIKIREERHQTLESACTFMEMEDGTQTNEMELHNKTDENGNILRGIKEGNDNWNTTRKQMELHEKMIKRVANFQKEHGVIPKCFGTFSCDRNMDKCFKCESVKECCMKANSENKAPNCFRHYDDKDSKCDNCEAKAGCAIATEEKEKEEAKKKSCFGSYQDCYMCTHCADYEKCKKETAKIKSGEDKVEINSKPERSDCCRINGRVPVCYGCYYEKGLYCPDCKSRESCVELTINREKDIEEDDDFI